MINTQSNLKVVLVLLLMSCNWSVYAQTAKNPLQHDDAIYVSEQGVYKYDSRDMSLQWSALISMQTFAPVISDGVLYVGSTQGMYALDILTGYEVWHIEDGFTLFSPVIYNQHLYAGSLHGILYDIFPSDGAVNWSSQFNGWVYSPVVIPMQKRLWTGGQAHRAIAVNMDNGEQIHAVTLAQEVIFSPKKIDDESVGYNLFDGSTVIINASSGSISIIIEGSSPAKNLLLRNGSIFRSSRSGLLTEFTKQSEQVNWQEKYFESGLTIYAGLKNRLLLSDEDRWLLLFDSKNKKLLWKQEMQGNWFLPMQLSENRVVVFYKNSMNLNNPVAVILDITHKK